MLGGLRCNEVDLGNNRRSTLVSLNKVVSTLDALEEKGGMSTVGSIEDLRLYDGSEWQVNGGKG
jgi:hypothetical protein